MTLAQWLGAKAADVPPPVLPPDQLTAAPAAYLFEGKPLKHSPIEVADLVTQLEQDVALTLQLIQDSSTETRGRVNESAEIAGEIQTASQGLASLSISARQTSDRLVETAHQMEISNLAIERQVAGSDDVLAEARGLAGTVGAQMRSLSEVARNIASVVETIRTIARQTNLLALNATIEAARAGAAGRGFSVVATEVKTLAGHVQASTTDIAQQISSLEAAVAGTTGTMTRMAELIARVDPVFDAIRGAASVQVAGARDVASRAIATADFADVVARSASSMRDLATSAVAVAGTASAASDTLEETLERLNRRSMLHFRQSLISERREIERFPVSLSGVIRLDGQRTEVHTVDLSVEGAMLERCRFSPVAGARGVLALDRIGDCPVTIVEVSEFGIHVAFETLTQALEAAIADHIAACRRAAAPHCALIREAAAELSAAFEQGIASGSVTLEQLVNSRYKPIRGSFPVQYDTAALPFYERTITPVLLRYRHKIPEAVFIVAVDRNSYLPVHAPEYSNPQVREDILWNQRNARNRRIMPRAQTLRAARNTDPVAISLYVRSMNDGTLAFSRLISAPAFVHGRLWGNIMSAFEMA